MAQETTWADRAGHAKSPGETGPVAELHDVDAQHTTRFTRNTERALASVRRPEADAATNRRRQASYRLPPLACGHRDPLGCLAAEVPFVLGPCRFGLTVEQARRHGNDLVNGGWTVAEVVEVLGIEPKAAA